MRLLAGRISALTSTGMKRHKAIWSLCPELVAGALKDSAKSIKSLQLVLFAIAPGRECKWKDQIITFNSELYSQVASNFSLTMPTDEQIQLCNNHNIDRICFIDNEWTPVGTLPVLEPQTIPNSPNALLSRWQAFAPSEMFARAVVHAFTDNPALDLIDGIDDVDKKEALSIAYQWAIARRENGEITRADFINRAKNERKSDYLRDNRDEIWDELQALL